MAGRAAVLTGVLILGFASTALASGTKGSPQPELALFKIAPSGGNNAGTVLSDGNLVVVTGTGSDDDSTLTVCVLHPGARSCASTTVLKPHVHDSFGAVQVFSTGGNDVTVVTYDCCYIGDNNAVVYNSTDGGKTFGKETQAGNFPASWSNATLADGQVVVTADDDSDGTQVQAFSPKPTSVETSTATISKTEVLSIGISTYDDGVLVASSGGVNTNVWYAAKGSDFNSAKSYKLVDTIKGQGVVGMSGSALLTVVNNDSLTDAENLQVFNGKSFSVQQRVPAPTNPDDGGYTLEEAGSSAHIFFVDRRDSYDIFTESTSNGGKSWSALTQLNADLYSIVPVLGPTGTGLCLEEGSSPLWAQPILNTQSVSVSVKGATLDGTAKPALKGQTVTLESKDGDYWNPVTTTKESSSGSFSFGVKSGTTYRAVVNEELGYYEYGYSNSVAG